MPDLLSEALEQQYATDSSLRENCGQGHHSLLTVPRLQRITTAMLYARDPPLIVERAVARPVCGGETRAASRRRRIAGKTFSRGSRRGTPTANAREALPQVDGWRIREDETGSSPGASRRGQCRNARGLAIARRAPLRIAVPPARARGPSTPARPEQFTVAAARRRRA